MDCKQSRQRILEQTLAGGTLPSAGPLSDHLSTCPACRAFARRLAAVDGALGDPPLERAPAETTQRVLEQIVPRPQPSPVPFLPWPVWAPLVSLLLGLIWAYLTLAWQRGPAWSDTLSPVLLSWPDQMRRWLGAHQGDLRVITASVAVGILLTILGVSLGLYAGRERASAG